MATYEYRCPLDGDFTLRLPLGEAPAVARCGSCQGEAGRVWSAPRLARLPRALATAIGRAERSAEAPEVVSKVPGRRPATARTADPRRARLPRI